MSFEIRIEHDGISDEIRRLSQQGEDLTALLFTIGQGMEERIDKRFATSTGPDGQRWKANSPVTLAREALRLAVSGANKKKDGSLNKRGQRALAGKRPLIGETGTLRDQIASSVNGNAVELAASSVYAAIQQFGGAKSQFGHLWGDIPARPFLPVTADGALYADEAEAVMRDISDYFGAPR